MAFDQVITLILGPWFIRAFQELGFKNLDIRKCIQNIPGNRDVALWIPQLFLQERIMSLDGISEASIIQKSFLACIH
jgi:hypothetical protein